MTQKMPLIDRGNSVSYLGEAGSDQRKLRIPPALREPTLCWQLRRSYRSPRATLPWTRTGFGNHDTTFYANVGAAAVVKDCKVFIVKNMRFEGFGLADRPTVDPAPIKSFVRGEKPGPWLGAAKSPTHLLISCCAM